MSPPIRIKSSQKKKYIPMCVRACPCICCVLSSLFRIYTILRQSRAYPSLSKMVGYSARARQENGFSLSLLALLFLRSDLIVVSPPLSFINVCTYMLERLERERKRARRGKPLLLLRESRFHRRRNAFSHTRRPALFFSLPCAYIYIYDSMCQCVRRRERSFF